MLLRSTCIAAVLLAFAACTTETKIEGGNAGPNASLPDERDVSKGDGGDASRSPDGTTSTPAGTALLRVLHVSQDVANVDVCLVSSNATIGPLYGAIGRADGVSRFANPGYVEVPSGTYEVRVVGAGLPCTQPPIVASKEKFEISPAVHSTVLVLGNANRSLGKRPPDVALLHDDVTADALERKVRFIHAAAEFGAEPIDLEWRAETSATYEVAFSTAPYGGVAATSPTATAFANGYGSIFFSDLAGDVFRFRTEAKSAVPPSNSVTSVNRIKIPKAKNFTVLFVGVDPSAAPGLPSFVICSDEDIATTNGGIGTCEQGFSL